MTYPFNVELAPEALSGNGCSMLAAYSHPTSLRLLCASHIGNTNATSSVLGPYSMSALSEPVACKLCARDSRLGRDVAIKILPAQFAADAERLRRFEQEQLPLPLSTIRTSWRSTTWARTAQRTSSSLHRQRVA